MTGFDESSTIQAALIAWLTDPKIGWKPVSAKDLQRTTHDVLLQSVLVDALMRLNPAIAEVPSRVNEVMPRIRAVIMSAVTDGLLAANERMVGWLRGTETHKFLARDDYLPIRLIDFDNPRANSLLLVSGPSKEDEVTFIGLDERRYDLVLFVNGIPLVVGETKTPTDAKRSWLNGAKDVHDCYEVRTPQFFVPNVLSFATEGKELRYGAMGQPPQDWLPWSRTTDPISSPSLQLVKHSAELLLTPECILDILQNYTLFTVKQTSKGTRTEKIIPRYPQVEATVAICQRVKDGTSHQGLVWHHQGSGKTYLMAFASAKIRRDLDMAAPTIVIVLDRLDLIEQTTGEFRSAGVSHLEVAETKEELRRLLAEDQRGVIITTIFRFAAAGELNTRANIVVMCDEAHRTQEGRLGADMREALPNATFIGLTGTPVSQGDHNTFATFGDPKDPGGVLNTYSVERSIADGATLPVHVEPRLVQYHIDRAALDEAFDLFAEEEGLDDEEKAGLAKRASRVETLMKVPARIDAVCEDIVSHFRAKVQPLGLKAQVVALDRELCVKYYEKISALLEDGEECSVVMTVGGKEGDADWIDFKRDRVEEAKLKARFRDAHDPLQLLIVTAKLLAGFDAPIEGVMYLDKPLKAHTLFQAITRTNRRYTNPITEQQKKYGLVVDYIGLGTEVATALNIKDTGAGKKLPTDVEVLYERLEAGIEACLAPFAGIARDDAGFATLMAAQERVADPDVRDAWAQQFGEVEGLWEFLWPETVLRKYETDYRWLAKVYQSVQPVVNADALLWHRLGQKTLELIATHIGDVRIDAADVEQIAVDEETVEQIKQLGFAFKPAKPDAPMTAAEVLDTIAARLAKKVGAGAPTIYESLADRLEALRRMKLVEAAASIDFLKQLLELAREVVEAERMESAGTLDPDATSLLPDPHIGALTQIFAEFKPDLTPSIVEKVVTEIDAIVKQVRFSGWQASQPGDKEVRRQIRLVLNSNSLPAVGPLFDRAYAYIAQNY